ncbi:MAG: class I SAM-dependent methyltransferase [Candidatus Latescibacteria bacterium]|nr:class I SAM-dependent methyltransferase [Candidatus Latescibacterota bacterium]
MEAWARALLPNPVFDLEQAVGNVDSLLDVGCGSTSPIRYFRRRLAYAVGVDGHAPSLDTSRTQGIHSAYHALDALEIDRVFSPGSFDCVLAADLIEHLTKEEGRALMAKMERISRRRVVIVTPNGFLPQGEVEGNPLQRHRSGWTAEEMAWLGYKVRGVNGWKVLRGERSVIRFRPMAFWALVSRLSQMVVRGRPEWAFQLLCVKEMGPSVPIA